MNNDFLLDELLKDYKPKRIPRDFINQLFEKFGNKLQDFNFIKNKNDFLTMKLGGTIKAINKSTEELSFSGILLKTYINKKNQYIALISYFNKSKVISLNFDKYYIFYKEHIQIIRNNDNEYYKKLLENIFISENDKQLYDNNIMGFKNYNIDQYIKKK